LETVFLAGGLTVGEAVKAYAEVAEISSVLRDVYGEYVEGESYF